MKFILGSIIRIVDDRIPVATRGVGATVGCGATRRSPLRVSCLLSSTKIALPNRNGVNIGISAKPFGTPILNHVQWRQWMVGMIF